MSTVPVIVIPGLFGSQITINGTTVFPSAKGSDLQQLAMTSAGTAEYTSQITKVDSGYNQLISALQTEGYKESNNTLFPLPYDWRYSLDDTVATSDDQTKISEQYGIAYRIKQIATNESGTGTVNIICHSMGCLATFYYLVNNIRDAESYVDKIIFLAPPLLGTVMAYSRLIGGIGPKAMRDLLTKTEWKTLFSNMMGIYQICPSQILTNDYLNECFLTITPANSTQTDLDYAAAYATNGSTLSDADSLINCDFLKSAYTWRNNLDSNLTTSGSIVDFMNGKGYLFWGEITESTDSHLYCTYSSDEKAPDITVTTPDSGDENVLYLGYDKLPAKQQQVFSNTTHMEMVSSPAVMAQIFSIIGTA